MFNKKIELPELRECKNCFRVVPLDQMHSGLAPDYKPKICLRCIELAGLKAALIAEREFVRKFEDVTISDLPKRKK